LFKSYNVG